jgi:hypothetical protein
MPLEPTLARQMRRTTEPVAGLVFLATEAEAEYTAIGLEPGRMGYFASRAAPMGAVPAEVVIATFYNFPPELVRASIPRAWTLASLDDILAARLRVVDAALHRVLGSEALGSAEVAEAAQLIRTALEGCPVDGRPLFAGHAALPWPAEPHLALWHGLNLARELRGDGHTAALVSAGHSGCQAIVMHEAFGDMPPSVTASRAWPEADWRAAQDDLRARGLLDVDGALTAEGRASRQWVEDRTDESAMAPWERLGTDGCERLRRLVRPFSQAIAASAFG